MSDINQLTAKVEGDEVIIRIPLELIRFSAMLSDAMFWSKERGAQLTVENMDEFVAGFLGELTWPGPEEPPRLDQLLTLCINRAVENGYGIGEVK